ncbi:LacI family DNA-binding transcriptional regulator [Amycolatopsis sp. Poz14]|uniref:LacI family DNA-binding transcriptional regulator n=1 Tax=Amycolatopsis sp. Poz14 TaxID=1447705 RepID=UPI001EE8ECE4|nr:LacI family DNA-binding transcriptional regulator [Amycolatopsis sp. Poz14]MCG3754750.1 LacI family DNA-binding transcriptional regulator [Amycolatopsis sp. Poz14]
MVTMREIARAAGVSQAAVSYAYNRPAKLSETQRRHILDTAARLGYAGPNVLGAGLRAGKVGAIGVMVMDSLEYAFTDPSTRALLEGIAQSRKFDDHALTLVPLPRSPVAADDGLPDQAALQGIVDGMIVHCLPDDHRSLRTLQSRGLPMVVVDAPLLPGVPRVCVQDRLAAQDQMRHLLDLGHRKTGVLAERLSPDGRRGLAGPGRRAESTERVVRERVAGYLDVAAGPVSVMEAGGFDRAAGTAAAHELLDTAPLTAIAATSDTMAIAALEAARARGLRVPDDLSVIGFDDAPDAERWSLTTMRQPMREKGRIVAEMLHDLLNGRTPAETVELPVDLVVRETTAPPAG